VRLQEKRCQESAAAFLEASEDAKAKKKTHDGDVATLRSMIRQYDQPMPLFSANGHATPAQAPEVQPDDGWKVLSIAQLGLPPKIVDIFAQKEITTLGALCDFQAAHGDWWHKKLEGIGPGKRGLIEDAQLKFWSENPQYCRAKVQDLADGVGTGQPAATPETPLLNEILENHEAEKPAEEAAAPEAGDNGDGGDDGEELYPDGVRDEE
jgi:hypothetical protein